jgi:hypothetical protein
MVLNISQDMKSKVQPSQDNRESMVKKLEKGATVTCYKCHGEEHIFYKCPQFVKGWTRARRRSAGTWEAWHNQDEKIQAYKPSLQIEHVLPKLPG